MIKRWFFFSLEESAFLIGLMAMMLSLDSSHLAFSSFNKIINKGYFVFQQRLGRTWIWPWKPSVFDLRLPGMTHMKKLKDSCDVSKVGWLKRVDIDNYVREGEFFPLRRRNTLYDGEIPFWHWWFTNERLVHKKLIRPQAYKKAFACWVESVIQ